MSFAGKMVSLKSRLERAERQAGELGESSSRLVPLTFPWPDEYGGPKTYMVTPEYIAALNKIYGHHEANSR